MTWVPCDDCAGDLAKQATCTTCHSNGGAFVMAPTVSRLTPPAHVECRWCGKTYAGHMFSELPGSPLARMPCLGRKSGFAPRETRRG